jgi:RNA polymerase sigma-70 factor (ECF subfamily)
VTVPSLAETLASARIGNNQAFAELQRELEPRIRRFAQRMIRNEAEVDDIVQRAFIAFYINIEGIHPPEKILPFLLRVTRNLAYDSLRRDYRREEIAFEDCEFRLHSLTVSPEDQAHWSLMLEELRAAMDCLPDIHRDTLILSVEENLSHAEIAEVMNTEIGTVKSRLHYARKVLRQILPSEFFEALAQPD